LRIAVTLLFLGGLVALLWPYLDDLVVLRDASPLLVALLLVPHWIGKALSGELLYSALRVLGYPITRREAVAFVFMRDVASLLVPRGGLAASFYLRAKLSVGLLDYGSVLTAIALLELGVLGALGLATLGLLAMLETGMASPLLALVFGTCLVASLLCLRLRPPRLWPRLERRINDVRVSWALLTTDRALAVRLVLVLISILAVRVGSLYLSFRALGEEVNLPGVVLASLAADLMVLVSLTPQGLGFREAAVAFAHGATGTTASLALAASLLQRATSVAVGLAGASISLALGSLPARRAGAVREDRSGK
jgi:uncharacterized membrane protein YbhN (UPF0104 family)